MLDTIDRLVELIDPRDERRERSPMAPRLVLAHGHGEAQTAEDIIDELWHWQRLWAERVGAMNAWVTDFLHQHILWAVHNPRESGWDNYRRDMRRIIGALRAIVGITPERLPDRCVQCGGRVVQDRADERDVPFPDGLQDEVRCTGCGLLWKDRATFEALAKAKISRLADDAPDALVTLEEAKVIFKGREIPSTAWRDWKRHDGLFDGTEKEPLSVIARLIERRAEQGRVGRPASRRDTISTP